MRLRAAIRNSGSGNASAGGVETAHSDRTGHNRRNSEVSFPIQSLDKWESDREAIPGCTCDVEWMLIDRVHRFGDEANRRHRINSKGWSWEVVLKGLLHRFWMDNANLSAF
jgi:hypothetical protein